MKIKVINFLHNGKKMHLKEDAELGQTINHLKKKFGQIEIHSIYPKDGPILYFTPPAKASELAPDFSYFKCLVSILFFIFLLFVAHLTIKYGYYKNY